MGQKQCWLLFGSDVGPVCCGYEVDCLCYAVTLTGGKVQKSLVGTVSTAFLFAAFPSACFWRPLLAERLANILFHPERLARLWVFGVLVVTGRGGIEQSNLVFGWCEGLEKEQQASTEP